ncbi:hypothetical protein QBC35DRAFT_460919 [Podospora australis]|uniref:Period circadian protein n=1 Tax=Podospora australis TaxID=1536484 RepID=A0AAN7AKN2_9PEZI|nr:hypothetical protein QBC35DRAFT_460919 [Podospora australis]
MSSIINKIKEKVHSDDKTTHNTGAPEGSHGPHNSRVANAADPRVDSDRDGSRTAGNTTGTHTTGTHTTGTHTTGTHTGATGFGRTAGHGEYGSSGLGHSSEGTHGPHSSRIANAADPRVDSDRDGSRTAGNTHTSGTGFGTTGHSSGLGHSTGTGFGSTGHSTGHTTGTGFGSSGHTTGGTTEGLHGPHSSRIANAADPRVDSDRDGSNTLGNSRGTTTGTGFGSSGITGGGVGGANTHTHHAGSGMTGMTGTHGAPTGTHGPHSSRVANAADPRVDSDRDGRGAIHSGPGPAPNTAGPHSSDMANKLDPRIDSDLDGSKTLGANKTYQSTTHSSTLGRDPTDAAQVPPSVMQKHIGPPIVEHDDHTHHRERRNSVKSHQEAFSGV